MLPSSQPGDVREGATPIEVRPPAAPPRGNSGSPSFRRVLSNPPFLRLWTAQLVSQSGDFIFEVALLWLVLKLTGSPFDVALMVTGAIIPGVVLGPFIGVYVDRWDRRRTLIATNVLQGLVIAGLSGLVVAGQENLTGLFAIVLMLGAGSTTVRTATGAYVPSVVPVEDLPPANSLQSLSGSMNQIVGLSIGGIFVALLGVDLPIEYDALTFFVAALILLTIPSKTAAVGTLSPPAPPAFRSEFSEGLAFIRKNRFMLELFVIGVIVNFFGNGIFALFAPLAAFVLHGGAQVYGALGAAVAAGALAGALMIGRIDVRRTAGRYIFLGGVGIGVFVLLVGTVSSVLPALAILFGAGVTLSITNIPISVVMQAKIPGKLLGRVGGTFGALIMATAPVGPLFAGWLAQRWSVSGVFLVFGLIIAVVIGLGAVTMGSLRRVEY
jgi:MFS transporter, DHA3 family, macrolide efflux protein